MAGGLTAPHMPNPRYEQLQRVLQQLHRSERSITSVLRGTCKRMESDDVWIGPSARAWSAKIHGYDAQLRRQVAIAIAEVQKALANTPKEINAKTDAMSKNPRF
jgi:hypothetical protein